MLSTIVWAWVRDTVFGSRSGAEVEGFAKERGWTYEARDKSLETLWTLQPFLGRRWKLSTAIKKQTIGFDKTGYLPKASYVASGTVGNWPVRAFEYSYLALAGDGVDGVEYARIRRYSVCAVALPNPRPLLEVYPENIGNRLTGKLGITKDIDFELEDFNRAFVIKADDKKFAYDVLHPRVMEVLLADARKLVWRIDDNHLVCWYESEFDAQEMSHRVTTLCKALDFVPRFVFASA